MKTKKKTKKKPPIIDVEAELILTRERLRVVKGDLVEAMRAAEKAEATLAHLNRQFDGRLILAVDYTMRPHAHGVMAYEMSMGGYRLSNGLWQHGWISESRLVHVTHGYGPDVIDDVKKQLACKLVRRWIDHLELKAASDS